MISAVSRSSLLGKYRYSAEDTMPSLRATARSDSPSAPETASCRRASSLISLVSSARARSRAVRPAFGGVAVVVTRLHVEARAEAFPRAGQQDHTAGRVAFHAVKRGVQVRDEGVVDRVQPLRAVERQLPDSRLRLVDYDGGRGHCVSSLSR